MRRFTKTKVSKYAAGRASVRAAALLSAACIGMGLNMSLPLRTFAAEAAVNSAVDPADGSYTVEAQLIGGSGRAHIESPLQITVEGGAITATIVMSSPNYDYMIVGGEKYLPSNAAGENSTFIIPIEAVGDVEVTADTVAMGTPHEIEYTIAMDAATLQEGTLAEKTAEEGTTEAAADQTVDHVIEDAADRTSEYTTESATADVPDHTADHATEAALVSDGTAPQYEIDGLTYTGSMERKYAGCFAVDYFEGGYKLLSIYMDDTAVLIVPEGSEIPAGLKEGLNEVGAQGAAAASNASEEGSSAGTQIRKIAVITQAPENIYLVATSAMDYFAKLGEMDSILLSGTKEGDWDIEQAQKAMAEGSIHYAGKYSAPDYEQILAGGCNLAVESTMIYHTPEVKEKLESFGIPVIVEHSSYEKHPLGRAEWIRYYGALLGADESAESIFEEMSAKLDAVIAKDKTDLKVAVFSLPTDGSVTVRKGSDYMASMIALAGGEYAFKDLGAEDDSASSTVKMTMEDFYAGAMDADVLIYNATIGGNQESLASLLEQNSVLAGFKAFQNGNVWCMTRNAFQHSTASADMITQIREILEQTGSAAADAANSDTGAAKDADAASDTSETAENIGEMSESTEESGNSDSYFYRLR